MKDLLEKGWLGVLVSSELERHDPETALARLPPEIRGAASSPTDLAPAAHLLVARSLRRLDGAPARPGRTFLEDVRLHVALALDIALLRGTPFGRPRRRAEIAAFLAAAVGDHEAALAVLAWRPAAATERAVRRALAVAEEALRARFYPPGDPAQGLPLHPGTVAIFRRRLARIAMGLHRDGRLDREALARHAAYAEGESALLAETLAGLLLASGPAAPRTLALRSRQVARLGLSRVKARDARRSVAAPRAPEVIAAEAPDRVRPFLVEQLLLAQLRLRLSSQGPARFLDAFVRATGLDPPVLAGARIEAAAQHDDHEAWFDALGEPLPGEALAGRIDWQAVADGLGFAADAVVERVSTAVTGNLEAILTEIRETGELGQLLARAAAGNALTAEEKRRVRAQLVDLAKAVPALAIFAAPGGMLLLPLLAKLLPFNLMPSAWEKGGGPAKPAGEEAKPARKADPAP